MTSRETIEEKYIETFNKKPRRDYSDDKLIAMIEKKTGNKIEEKEPLVTVVTETPSLTKKEVKAEQVELEKVKRGRCHLVYWNGTERWWTHATIQVALKQKDQELVYPEGSLYDPEARNNKCENC